MTRREEVEASIKWIMSAGISGGAITPNMRDLARTLADEVDERDAVITKLLAELKPTKPVREKLMDSEEWGVEYDKYVVARNTHARACEIAGRKE